MKRFLSVLLIALCLVAFVLPAHAFHGVEMSYAATGSSGITVADNDNIDFGTGNFTLVWKGSLPDWTPSVPVYTISKYQDANNELSMYVDSSTGVAGIKWLVTGGTTVDKWTSSPTGFTDGSLHEMAVVVARETASVAGSVIFYFDGVHFGSTRTITAGTPASIVNTGTLQVTGRGAISYASTTYRALTFNRALSAAEVKSLYENGVAEADKYGSQTAVYTSDFSAGVDGWTVSGGAETGNIDSIGGQNDTLRFTCNTSTGGHMLVKTGVFTTGKRYRIQYDYYIPSTNSNLNQVRTYDPYVGTIGTDGTVLNTWTTITTEATVGGGTLNIIGLASGVVSYKDAGGDDVFYIKNVVVTQIGATLALEPSGITATDWQDSSSNNLDGTYPAAGWRVFYSGQRGLLGVGQ